MPEKIQSKFSSTEFAILIEEYNVHHFFATDGTIKCTIVERFNGTLRTRLYPYLHHRKTECFIDFLREIICSYNNSYDKTHRTIGMEPKAVNSVNNASVLVHIRMSHTKVKIKYKPFAINS